MDRLQAIDTVVKYFNQFASNSADGTNKLLLAAAMDIESDHRMVEEMRTYIIGRSADSIRDQERVHKVVDEVQRMSTIIDLIKRISSQTNLLAAGAQYAHLRPGAPDHRPQPGAALCRQE